MGCAASKQASAVDLPRAKLDAPKNGSNHNAKANTNSKNISTTSGASDESARPRLHSSGSDCHAADDRSSGGSSNGSGNFRSNSKNPKTLVHSTSQIGLDEMIEDRRAEGDLRQNVVHIEVPFGKPIEEVYDGVHNGPVLGSGISGLVRLVTHKATGLKYAVKVLDLALVDTAEGLRQLREEIFIMCQLDHPNIVRLEEVYESHSEIYLVQELCLGGELFDRLDEQPDYHYTESECAKLVKQMLSAVRYLHSKGIIHRDLKLENFLFSSTAKDSELKAIDFGLSKHFRYGEIQHEAVGTPYSVAPEVILGSYDERCDCWAIGVITFLLLSGDPPFGGCGGPESLMQVRSNILAGKFDFVPEDIWCSVSKQARNFIRTLLVTDPQKRPTARNAQKHPWLTEWAYKARDDSDNVLNPNVVKALVNFKEFSDMRKLLCEVLSFTLLPDQIKDLRREFEKMDTDGSGEISLAALKQVLVANAGAGSLGALTEEEVEDIFNAMRVRKTETRIHWHEFIAAGLSQCQVDDRNLRLAFDRLDSDHKGYITLDDIMDLMGSDAIQSEEQMREMWGDSIRSVKCQHARITYGDFLLLMKGQSRETPPSAQLNSELGTASLKPLSGGRPLLMVREGETASSEAMSPVLSEIDESELTMEPDTADEVPSTSSPLSGAAIVDNMGSTDLLQYRSASPLSITQSAPNTPAGHRQILDMADLESPGSYRDRDILAAGPGVPGTSASLTPPQSPERGAKDFCTPNLANRFTILMPSGSNPKIIVPGLPEIPPHPDTYLRRQRSRSVGDDINRPQTPGQENDETTDLQAVADVVMDMLLPENGHLQMSHNDNGGGSKSHLMSNRQLYRAHRHMRMAVLEASKRFEEQQAEHTRDLILKEREGESTTEESGMFIQPGLVMRHGHHGHVSSEAIRQLMAENRKQQGKLVEEANRRGGRGRRSRKKTASDMSGMLSSMGNEELGGALSDAKMSHDTSPPKLSERKTMMSRIPSVQEGPDIASPDEVGTVRQATVPGQFRKTSDPFSKQGKYGAVYQE
ncbi:hypothetical protein MPSEU_000023200 [Mayamaea pseudoterrestris]|nr:hypothetical protein MPSEU_000023200 [Mayamaea pseudoterrestris]